MTEREYDIFYEGKGSLTESEFISVTASVITEAQARQVFEIIFREAGTEDDWPHEESIIVCFRGADAMPVAYGKRLR